MFVAGLDLAQAQDYTALSILHYIEPARWKVKERGPHAGTSSR